MSWDVVKPWLARLVNLSHGDGTYDSPSLPDRPDIKFKIDNAYASYPACYGPEYLCAIGATQIQYVQCMGGGPREFRIVFKCYGYEGLHTCPLHIFLEWSKNEFLKVLEPAVCLLLSQFDTDTLREWLEADCCKRLKAQDVSRSARRVVDPVLVTYFDTDSIARIQENRTKLQAAIQLPNMVLQTAPNAFKFMFTPRDASLELGICFYASRAADKAAMANADSIVADADFDESVAIARYHELKAQFESLDLLSMA